MYDPISNFWTEKFVNLGVLQTHNDEPDSPHHILKDGRHAEAHFDGESLLTDSTNQLTLSNCVPHLLEKLHSKIGDQKINLVISLNERTTTLTELICNKVNYDTKKNECSWQTLPEPPSGRGRKPPVFTDKEKEALSGKNILLCTDYLETDEELKSIALILETINEAGGIAIPYVLSLVNSLEEICQNDLRVISLINIKTCPKRGCYICETGSKAVDPGKIKK